MPLDAFALALGSAFLHALWNLILGRERDPEAATAVALMVSVVVFAPVAACIAAYTLVDAHGVEHADPIVYLELGMIPATIGYVGFLVVARGGSDRIRAAARPLPALAGVLSFVAYALVLGALLLAPAASVAAVRETSVLIAALLAVPLAHERVGPGRIAGAALVVAGVALIALG